MEELGISACGATTKTEVVANRYRDLRRDNSLQGLMLTHRPNRIVSSKACGFCHALRHETPYGVTKTPHKCGFTKNNIWYNHHMKSDIQYADEIYQIQGAIFAVYKEMGNAWHEEVYQQCLERELSSRGIPFNSKKELRIYYRGEPIEKTYIPDIICYDKIILELKTVDHLTNEHKGQLLNYLRITGITIGLLINFRAYPKVEIIRMAH